MSSPHPAAPLAANFSGVIGLWPGATRTGATEVGATEHAVPESMDNQKENITIGFKITSLSITKTQKGLRNTEKYHYKRIATNKSKSHRM